ncbi:hypothetical protein [Streptomyces sp. NPDC023327]|uniref:hypothetical protein n=1 Tax=Streptomyces sp. NPDC023327 TaxID=3157088 RepID=UPI0033D0C5FF
MQDELLKAQAQRKLLYLGSRPLATVLRPRLVSGTEQAAVAQAGTQVASAAQTLVSHFLSGRGDDLSKLVHTTLALSPVERTLARLPSVGPVSSYGRLDGFRTDDALMFVEYNADSCACALSQDLLVEAYTSTSFMQEIDDSCQLDHTPAVERMAELALRTWKEGGEPGGAPEVAVVDWPQGSWAWEFEPLCAALRARGATALCCTPDDLEFTAGRLATRGPDRQLQPITLVIRRVPVGDLVSRLGHHLLEHPLVRASAAGGCVVMNPLAADLVQRKSLFALLDDERVRAHLPADQATALSRHIPWTRVVRRGSVTVPGGERDLLEYAAEQRERLVLKPDNGYAGQGVKLGWQCSPREWEATLRLALSTPYVVQERVAVPRVPYPVVQDGCLSFPLLAESTDPMIFGGAADGIVCRHSGTSTLNVSCGGALTPAFTVCPSGLT